MTDATSPLNDPHATVMEIAGVPHYRDAKGAWVPKDVIKTSDLLEDEVVRKILGYGVDLSAQIGRFKQHTFDDVDGLLAVLAQDHGTTMGGRRGNITLTSYDGLVRVQVAVADKIEFGPQLQIAKTLVDECLTGWSEGAAIELQAVVKRAFNTDQAGKVSPSDLFYLLRLDIDNERWQQAMKAIRDSIRVLGTKRYVRLYRRASAGAQWESVPLDVATAPLREDAA